MEARGERHDSQHRARQSKDVACMVPVLVDGDRTLHDSWNIAEYLDEAYPDLPSLFFGSSGKATTRFTVHWVDQSLLKALRNIISLIAVEVSADKDKAYYCNKLETVHGVNLQTAGDTDSNVANLKTVLEPMRLTLETQAFLAGSSPSYADFAAAGAFAWARSVSKIKLLEEADPVFAWRRQMFDVFHQDLAETVGYPI